MDLIIEWIDEYRRETEVYRRTELAGSIYFYFAESVQLFIFTRTKPSDSLDVWQDTAKAILVGLSTFRGRTEKEFLKWCYQIARNKISDSFKNNRLDPFPTEELSDLLEASRITKPFSQEDEVDLKDAMDLLAISHPECRELLWDHFIFGFDYEEIAEELHLQYDAVRMRIKRCLDTASGLLGD